MRLRSLCISTSLLMLSAAFLHARAQGKPWPIRAVIAVTFEVGNDTGDIPGEYQFWVEREHLDEVLDFPVVQSISEVLLVVI